LTILRKEIKMAFYLVTGGAGFIGSNIVEELIKNGENVRIIDNFITGKKENIKELLGKIELIEGDIRDINIVKKAVKGVDFILHQAALRSVPKSVDNPLDTNDSNITGTLNVLIAARDLGIKKVVYASSSSVYGDAEKLPEDENQLPKPKSPYAVSKLCGEYYCKVFSELYRLETVSLRYFNVFGPRQDPESKYAAVIPIFIKNALNDEPLEIHGDGLQSRDFTYVKNVVDANIKACNSKNLKGEVFNIGCGERYSVLEIAKLISKILKKELKYNYTHPRPGDVRHTHADISKAKKILGYEENVKFEQGLKRTIEYFIKNPWRLKC
jgi:UDP-glucose 4-epimerase